MSGYKDELAIWCPDCGAVVEYECLCPGGTPAFPLVKRKEALRLGAIQKDIVSYLKRCGENGGCICSTTQAEEFRGYDLEQVERSLNALLARGIVRRESIRHVLVRRQ